MREQLSEFDSEERLTVIKFPDDMDEVAKQERLGALKRKLDEYNTRLKGYKEVGPYTSPEQNRILDTLFKIFILKTFLANPEETLETHELLGICAEKYLGVSKVEKLDEMSNFYWQNAFEIIGDYVSTGGKFTIGGGLK